MNIAVQAALLATLASPQGHRSEAVPFGVGEVLEYGGSYKILFATPSFAHVATLSVVAIDTVRGLPCWQFSFLTDFSVPLYHNHGDLKSWTTIDGFTSLRFYHWIDESNYSIHDDFRIFPDSGIYRNERDHEAHSTPRNPLDDVAFFYYIRLPSTPLKIGTADTVSRYFLGDRNPVVINVLRREPCDLPDDLRASCLVLNPIVEAPPHGMFMKEKNALLWVTDDWRRLPVKIRSGPYTMELKKITTAPSGSR